MIAPEPDDLSALDHVLILAPYRSDADYLRRLLFENEVRADLGSAADLPSRLEASPGVLLLTHEAPAVLDAVGSHLRNQPSWSEMPIAEIADLTFEPYRLVGTDRIATSGPDVMLSRDAGTTLALCLHELATNAIKYGALSVPDGRVQFEWAVSEGEQRELSILWRERGGPTVVDPARAGYGTRYLRSAFSGMLGQKPVIAFDPEGLRCEARGALSRVSDHL